MTTGFFMRMAAGLSVLGIVAGCTTGGGGGLFSGSNKAAAVPPPAAASANAAPAYVRGTCPNVELREGTAFYRTYKGGAKDKDPAKVVNQASLTDTTRKCTVNGNQLTMEIAAAGRVVAGPEGGPGTVTMPIRVAVIDTDGKTVYSDLTKDTVKLDQNGAAQFLFTKPGVTIPADKVDQLRVFVGFDEGPYNTP